MCRNFILVMMWKRTTARWNFESLAERGGYARAVIALECGFEWLFCHSLDDLAFVHKVEPCTVIPLQVGGHWRERLASDRANGSPLVVIVVVTLRLSSRRMPIAGRRLAVGVCRLP